MSLRYLYLEEGEAYLAGLPWDFLRSGVPLAGGFAGDFASDFAGCLFPPVLFS